MDVLGVNTMKRQIVAAVVLLLPMVAKADLTAA
jgi:hypothetical protein